MKKWMKFFGVGQNNNTNQHDDMGDDILGEEDDSQAGQIALDILETDDELIILAPIGGIDLGDIDLSFNQSILTIKGYRNKPEMFYNDVAIRSSECFWGKFVRNVILPENLDFDSIKASLENNLLLITINKLQFPSQNIKINKIEG